MVRRFLALALLISANLYASHLFGVGECRDGGYQVNDGDGMTCLLNNPRDPCTTDPEVECLDYAENSVSKKKWFSILPVGTCMFENEKSLTRGCTTCEIFHPPLLEPQSYTAMVCAVGEKYANQAACDNRIKLFDLDAWRSGICVD